MPKTNRYIIYYKIDLFRGNSVPRQMNTHEFFSTYKAVEVLNTDRGLEHIWYQMQGENWSPNGELREYIRALGLNHTSMSVGDVVYSKDDNNFFIADNFGWEKLELT